MKKKILFLASKRAFDVIRHDIYQMEGIEIVFIDNQSDLYEKIQGIEIAGIIIHASASKELIRQYYDYYGHIKARIR